VGQNSESGGSDRQEANERHRSSRNGRTSGGGRAGGEEPPRGFDDIPEQFLLLVTCRDEKHQVELLQRFHTEGIQVKALVS